ncbi:DNA-binding response OmpR family regulator [Microvirga flocculans]|uniref:Regulatory protein VirG n=2 Tax=Microvirga flocculans TaxID=217168 RepID=A0A7W6IF57_9HYPH|nr:DNA-binding response OmpR family regulator [Microvirga flocculans]
MLVAEHGQSANGMSHHPAHPAHILVVDDDARIRSMLSRYFEGEGFQVSLAESGAQMRQRLEKAPVDLILLDLGLPDTDGLALARDIRARSEVGIIIMTGRSDDVDRIVGLEVGADDYVSKPFNLRELLARVRSVLRRLQPAVPTQEPKLPVAEEVICFDGWILDRNRRLLTSPDGREISLTTGEFDLLSILVGHAGRVLTRDYLMDRTRGRSWQVFDRSIDAQVSRLRRKIEGDAQNPRMLKSVRGVGYIFTAKVTPSV